MERDRRRFLREIRTTAQLEHPGTPAVYDTGVETRPDGSSQLWLVMQLLRGSTLEAALDHADYAPAPPSVAWAAAITAQIAAVLADVHRVDIVHRDIKPANVMLVDGGMVKVLDFGIAILRGAGALPRLTQVDRTVGTPAYMSPEQCLGRRLPLRPTSTLSAASCTSSSPATCRSSGRRTCRCGTITCIPLFLPHGRSVPTSQPPSMGWCCRCWPKIPRNDQRRRRSMRRSCHWRQGRAGHRWEAKRGNRDPTRPFRWPLLAAARRREQVGGRGQLTDAEADLLMANVRALLDNDRPSRRSGSWRTASSAPEATRSWSQVAALLGAALFYAGEYTRAASLLDVAGVTTASTSRRTTLTCSTAPTTRATPTPRSASRTRPCRNSGST